MIVLKRSGGLPLWEWGCNVPNTGCGATQVKAGGEAREVVAAAKAHTLATGHETWLHNILMWSIWEAEA